MAEEVLVHAHCMYSIEIVGHAMTQRDARCGQLVLVRACACANAKSPILPKKRITPYFSQPKWNTRRNHPYGAGTAYESRCRQCSICCWFPVLSMEPKWTHHFYSSEFMSVPETLRITLQHTAHWSERVESISIESINKVCAAFDMAVYLVLVARRRESRVHRKLRRRLITSFGTNFHSMPVRRTQWRRSY